MLFNIGFVAAAGSGKTTCTDYLVAQHGYRNHALAAPLKVTAAFNIARQFRMEILGKPYSHWYDHIDRIIHGEMGVVPIDEHLAVFERRQTLMAAMGGGDAQALATYKALVREHGMEGFSENRYAEDIAVRDALLAIERQYKPQLRGEEQQYGTEVIRKIAELLHPGTWLTPAEEWTTILAKECRRDNRAGIAASCDDVRHHHEATTIAETLDEPGILIRIERAQPEAIGMTAERAAHSSEQEWMKIPTHYRIINNGAIDDLYAALDAILVDAPAHLATWGFLPLRSLDWSRDVHDAPGLSVTALPTADAA